MFEDPAVMRIVEGRPSLMVTNFLQLQIMAQLVVAVFNLCCLHLKSLDNAIVDCGPQVYRNAFQNNVSANIHRLVLRYMQLRFPSTVFAPRG